MIYLTAKFIFRLLPVEGSESALKSQSRLITAAVPDAESTQTSSLKKDESCNCVAVT